MHVIVIPRCANDGNDPSLLRNAFANEPLSDILIDGLAQENLYAGDTVCRIAVPREWPTKQRPEDRRYFGYAGHLPIAHNPLTVGNGSEWLIITYGRFAAWLDPEPLDRILHETKADLLALQVCPDLSARQEKACLKGDGNIAGFRRCYADATRTVPVSANWPHHLFIRGEVVEDLLTDDSLPLEFDRYIQMCHERSLSLLRMHIAGAVLDLECESSFLSFIRTQINRISQGQGPLEGRPCRGGSGCGSQRKVSPQARLLGNVVLGDEVEIGPRAIIVGPSIIGDHVTIGANAVIRSSVIGAAKLIGVDCLIQNRVLIDPQPSVEQILRRPNIYEQHHSRPYRYFSGFTPKTSHFIEWPRFSYTRCLKRVGDIVAALLMHVVFVFLFPLIALAIKMTSPGPVFFGHKRQGLQGKEFYCLKFRTMVTGADKMQEQLRVLNQVDGPQFKLKDDPRVSAVGKFLRNTCLDELPQFINVLRGQMSVVGPRPSPEEENSLCPCWRDARLSVRPGITGLWQVCRTRKPGQDFQEWVHYDIDYVKHISLKMDLWICGQTVKKLMREFLRQL